MQISYQWLKQWVAVDISAAELAERLTAAGLEVDAVEPVAAAFSGVVVGEIIACAAHPDADKLQVCSISDGSGEPLQVVCGAPNARPGLRIPFARVGAELAGPDGKAFKIKKAKLRGVESHGMACSARELGLSEDHSGLMELPGEAPLGEDFRSWLELDDFSIDIELTPNRADCLGIKGLARDVAAICAAPFTPLNIAPVAASIDDCPLVTLEAPEDCPHYVGRIIRGINPAAATPLWMAEALRRCGIRSISAVVDATNYVLLELGQPMHAFDLAQVAGEQVVVRRGRDGERLTLLDGKEVAVDESLLAICDAEKPVALAGIMGGLDSGVGDATTDILLESAWFRPATIMGKARDLGLHTDASHRFERGVDPSGQVAAIERITALLLQIVGGQAGPLAVAKAAQHLPQPQTVRLRLARLNRVLGSELEAEAVQGMLERLGMQLGAVDGGWDVLAPPARFDIAIEEDLIEEVARVHGYDRLPAALPSGELRLRGLAEAQVSIGEVRAALTAAGYFEAVTYAFVDSGLLGQMQLGEGMLPLANPISSDMDVMRTALLPGLLMALARNLRRQQERVRLFEIGKVFHQGEALVETERLSAVACGPAWPEQWGARQQRMDFYDAKRDLQSLLDLRGYKGEVEFVSHGFPFLHPGQSAAVIIDGQPAGWLGAVHPGLLAELDIRAQVFSFELDLAPLLKREIPFTKIISPYPSVRRDLAFLVPEKVSFNEINKIVNTLAGDLLAELRIFDQFSGESVEKGYKSLAIGLILQDVSCTLTDEVVDSLVNRVVNALGTQLDAQLRG
jgi:phenylalanyl-tRNA synthetase beta chain